MLYVLFCIILLFNQNNSLKLDQNYQVASWEDSGKLCDLAGESDLCNSTSDWCNLKVSKDDVSHIFSNPLWINGYVTRPPWVYQIGCTEVKEYLLPSHRTGVFKLNTNQTINDCVTFCGNSSSYGLSGLLCHCLLDLNRTKSDLSNCHSSCRIGTTIPCDKDTNNDGVVYITEYKQYTGSLLKNISYSPWYSCTATNSSILKTEDCRKNLPFICINQSGFEIHNTLVTWYTANKHCKDEGMILINKIPLSHNIQSSISAGIYFWTGIYRPLQWTWDKKKDFPNSDDIDCLVLNQDENGLELQTQNCSFDGLSGLCVNVQAVGNMTFNLSETHTDKRGNKDNINVESNNSSVYIGIGIGALVLCTALIVGAVIARKRFIKDKKSRLLLISNGTKGKTDVESDASIPLGNGDKGTNKTLNTDEYKDTLPQENAEKLTDTKQGQSSSAPDNSNTKEVDVVIETVPAKHKNKPSSKSASKKKKTREIEISIEDESVTIVDDGSYDTQLSQNV